ncbi:histone H4 transcription factor-like [Diadema antillarum]|uniref:histone H4 transcription factor-like n=1 Tax=Diadema antillarum TaxID=105358 RepID=UPI003A8BDD6C
MAPVPMKERKKMELQCEWGSCREKFGSSQAFTDHLIKHAEEFIAGRLSIENCLSDTADDSEEYQCEWADCGHVTEEGSPALLRHLLFHGYHTRIKWQGTVERERCKVEPCQLESHSRNIIPEVPNSFRCGWCDCSFITNNPDYFYCHVEMHGKMAECSKGVYACQWTDCHSKTKNIYKLREHLRCHSQEKRFGCSQCGGLFSNRTKFFDHIRRQGILDEPNYQCSHCSKVFASERLLRDHMRHHVNHYKCPFCDMTCPAPSVLKKHIQWRHSTDRPFSCELCPHRAKTRTDMRRHLESHNAEDAYQCDVEDCQFVTKSLSALRAHFRLRHAEMETQRYMCHVCDKKFARGNNLTKHLKDKHRFKWPSGHVRFRYKEHEDGYLRLQTVRYESIELTQQILQENPSSPQQLPTLTAEDSTSPSVPNSDNVPYELQYLQDEQGRIYVVNCTGNVRHKRLERGVEGQDGVLPMEEVYQIMYMNKERSSQATAPSHVDSAVAGGTTADDNGVTTADDNAVANSPGYQTGTVVLESGGQPISHRHAQEEVRDASPEMAPVRAFPIEQMQSIDEASDRESGGEPTPKKARFESENVLPTISEDERLRNLFPSLEDDRMAMAVEAMTNLSRGFTSL